MTQALPFISAKEPWLAPLAGFSDLPFRLLCRRWGCKLACTEMISAKGLVLGSATWKLLHTCPEDSPLVVQLFGSEKRYISQAMEMLLQRGFRFFDLNAGCAVRKVVKTGAGAALLQEPGRLLDLAGEMLSWAGPGRVGVKLRIGWEQDSQAFLRAAQGLQELRAGWVTLHPRTARQGFSGQANWSRLKELQESVDLPVIGSGDLFTARQGLDCLQQTGIQGVMFARGALTNPGIFQEFKALFSGVRDGSPEPEQRLLQIRSIALEHIRLSREYSRQPRAFFKMRTVLPKYLKGVRQARELRSRIVACRDWQELESLVQGI
ncbi:MAG: tRNA-dihydrouridine synthase family protein [Desulfohalobiaceae bacterium]